MRKIYKYYLQTKLFDDKNMTVLKQTIKMPVTALLWHIGVQNETICLWAQVDTDFMKGERTFVVVVTGQEIPEFCKSSDYRGTVQIGFFVWHIYEVK